MQYSFLTTWLLEASREAVWEVLQDVERWPRWWRGVERTSVLGEDRYRVAWRSRIPYELEFDFAVEHTEEPREMKGRATGALTGTGHWRLFERDGVTAVLYDWRVQTTKRWMNALGPVARPVFGYNHDVVMRWGGEGLARELDCNLLAAG
jgi:carbon monoxide dehydrogenase subunit G